MLDLIFAGILFVSFVMGWLRGLVYEVLALTAWVAAFVLGQMYASTVSSWLPMMGLSDVLRHAVGFLIVFVASVFAGGLLATLAKRMFTAVGLQPADRALGAGFGLTRGIVILLALTVVILMTPLQANQWWKDSIGAQLSVSALRGLKPLMPSSFGIYLPV